MPLRPDPLNCLPSFVLQLASLAGLMLTQHSTLHTRVSAPVQGGTKRAREEMEAESTQLVTVGGVSPSGSGGGGGGGSDGGDGSEGSGGCTGGHQLALTNRPAAS